MNKLILIILVLVCNLSWAYYPPFEELVSKKLTDFDTGLFLIKTKIENVTNTSEIINVEFSVFKNSNKYLEVNQVIKDVNGKLLEVVNLKNLNLKTFKLEQGDLNKVIFFSVLNSQFLGESNLLIAFDKNLGGKFKFKDELINSSKTSLMTQYKSYLKNQQYNKDQESPLNPKNKLEEKRVNKIYYSNLYNREEYINIIKNNDLFYYKASDDFFDLLFDQENRNLSAVKFKSQVGLIEINLLNYIPFSENKLFAKNIYVKDLEDKMYRIEILDFKASPIKYEQYSKEKAPILTGSSLSKPSFLL
jgi:hypothetical protein